MSNPRLRPTRILALVCIGPVFLIILMGLAYLRFRMAKAGISGWISESLRVKPIQAFGIQYALRILVPVYFTAGILAWFMSFGPGLLFSRTWRKDWKGREALGFGLSAMLWIHLVLWWQVPTTLWVLPGLRAVPFWLLFPLLAALGLIYPLLWLIRREGVGLTKGACLFLLWIALWTTGAQVPSWLPRPSPAAKGGTQPCKVLMLGIDGLRSDTFLDKASNYTGLRYQNAYTAIPTTRLLWHILWGGDPLTYTIGHVAPAVEEFRRPHELTLLKEALAQGWKPRFYIDDGGTIGTVGRQMDLDDALMPANGWENFVNSNLAVGFPLYATWENWFKPFPTTNPWASMDSGLKEALRLGRGSGWVMFHSCLAHQPIFLNRRELKETGQWWTLSPARFEPFPHVDLITAKDIERIDPRTNPFLAYQIRMGSILKAWEPIWNHLAKDPDYGQAVRVLFSDHGERFHNVTGGLQLQGVHGFNLDPWECRVTLLMAGSGFSEKAEPTPRQETVSLLALRDGIHRLVMKEGSFDAQFLQQAWPTAPIRYHSLGTSAFGKEPFDFRVEPEKDLAIGSYIGPGGLWFTNYSTSAAERAKDASVAYAKGPELFTFKPLVGGGAKAFHYDGYKLLAVDDIDEETFQREKKRVEGLLSRPSKEP
jgi:hypothetical protein